MIKLTRKSNNWIGAILITLFMLSSCSQETDIEIDQPEITASFDDELSDILDVMDSQPESAIERLDQLIIQAEEINSRYYTGKSKWYKGYIYDDILEDIPNAYIQYNEALKDILQTDASSLKMDLYNNLGILYRFYGQYDAAISNYESAIKLQDELSNKQLSNVFYNYGIALKLKGDSISFYKAEEAFSRSLDYAKEVAYHSNIARVHNQIGLMYKSVGNYEMARIAHNNTINSYSADPEQVEIVGKAYHGIGVTYMEEGNAEAAIRAFNKALDYKKNSGSIFITMYDLGTVLMDDGRRNQAIAVWKDALKEKHKKNSIEQVKIYADLTEALQLNNEYEEAIGYSQVFNSSVQNILEEEKQYKAKNNQVLFANIIKEYEEFNRPVPYFQRPLVVISMLLGSILLVYVLSFVYYRSKFRRKVSETVSEIQSEFLHIKVD